MRRQHHQMLMLHLLLHGTLPLQQSQLPCMQQQQQQLVLALGMRLQRRP